MSRTKTLAQLRSVVENQADIVGATSRYSATLLNGLINQSIQRFRERVSIEGSTRYLTQTSGALTVGAASGLPFQIIELASVAPGVVRTFGVDLTIDGTIISLEHRPFEERTKFGTQPSRPLAWAPYADKIAILPPPVSAYPYTVWYLPLLADLVSDSDTFDGVAGWEDFVVWDVFQRLATRDTYDKVFQQATFVKDQIVADIVRGATKVSHAGGAHRGRDTMGALGIYGVQAKRSPSIGGGPPGANSVTNQMLAQMAARTLKVNAAYSSASPQDRTGSEAADLLPSFAGAAGGLVPTGAGNSALFLNNAGGWTSPSVGGSVTGLALTQLGDIHSPRVIGLFGTPTGAPTLLTGQHVASMIGTFTGSAHGLVPYPSGGAQNFVLRDDGTWVAQSGGSSTGIANNQLALMAPLSVKGNFSAVSGAPADLDKRQVASLMPDFWQSSGASRGFVWSPTAGAANRFLRDDGSWQSPPTGTIPIPSGIGLPQLGDIQSPRFLGRITAGSGGIEQLTPNQAASMLPNFFAPSGGPRGLVYSPTAGIGGLFLRDDGSWQTPAGGAGGGPTMLAGGGTGALQYNNGSGFAGASGIFTDGNRLQFNPSGALTGLIGIPHSSTVPVLAGLSSDGLSTMQLVRWGNAPNRLTDGGITVPEVYHGVTSAGHHGWQVGGNDRLLLNDGLLTTWPGVHLGVARLAIPDSVGDKLGTWTASGFANHATGINITASGTRLSVGSGGPQLHASGIDMRSGDIRNVRRLNGLDGIKLYGDLPDADSNVTEPSGTAFIIPLSVTTGRVYTIVPSGTEHGKAVLIENRSAFSHSIHNSGTGMGAPSGWIATLAPSGGMSARFASGAWEFGSKYQLGGF